MTALFKYKQKSPDDSGLFVALLMIMRQESGKLA